MDAYGYHSTRMHNRCLRSKKDRTGGRNLYGTGSQYRATVVGHCSSSGGRTECQHPKGFGPLQLFARRDGRLVECPGKSSLRFPKREQSRRYYWCPYRHPHECRLGHCRYTRLPGNVRTVQSRHCRRPMDAQFL